MTDNLAKKQIRKEQARLRQFETEFNNDFSIPVDIGEILTVKWPQKWPLMTFLKCTPKKSIQIHCPIMKLLAKWLHPIRRLRKTLQWLIIMTHCLSRSVHFNWFNLVTKTGFPSWPPMVIFSRSSRPHPLPSEIN